MNTKRKRAVLRFLAFLSALASSAVGIMFIIIAPGMPPGLRFLFLVPLISTPVLVGLLVWHTAQPRSRVWKARMALREEGPPPKGGRSIVLIKQKRSR